jgi:hypothetical protein
MADGRGIISSRATRHDTPTEESTMSKFQIDAFEALTTDLIREEDALRRRFDVRAEELARPMVEALFGVVGVELVSCQFLPDGLEVRIRFREEGRERVRTIGGDELVRLFLGCAAEEAFPCE